MTRTHRRGSRPGRGRAPLAAVSAIAVLSALAACSGDTDPAAADEATDDSLADCQEAAPTGTFSVDDARGEKVELDEVPTTVVAQGSVAASLWDAGYQVDGVYGEIPDADAVDYQLGNVDLDQVEVLGRTWGEFDVDQYAAMQPDLLVDYSFDGSTMWYVPSKQAKQIEKLATTVAVNGQPKTIDEAIPIFVDLATQLGADTTCDEDLEADQQAYEEALTEISENERDLQVLIASGTETSFYVVNPTLLPETGTLTEAGVDLIEPKSGEPDIFHELSWEEAADYAEADVILVDARNTEAVRKKMETIDTWANLPAVQAGQVYTWYAAAPYSYKAYAEIFGELAGQLGESEPLEDAGS